MTCVIFSMTKGPAVVTNPIYIQHDSLSSIDVIRTPDIPPKNVIPPLNLPNGTEQEL